MSQIDTILTLIAQKHLGIETLETRHSDSLDFHDVAVWCLRDALEAERQRVVRQVAPLGEFGRAQAARSALRTVTGLTLMPVRRNNSLVTSSSDERGCSRVISRSTRVSCCARSPAAASTPNI